MDITLSRKALSEASTAIRSSIREGDADAVRGILLDLFTDQQVDEIEGHLATDFHSFLAEVTDEWDEADVEDLFELLQYELTEVQVHLHFSGEYVNDRERGAFNRHPHTSTNHSSDPGE